MDKEYVKDISADIDFVLDANTTIGTMDENYVYELSTKTKHIDIIDTRTKTKIKGLSKFIDDIDIIFINLNRCANYENQKTDANGVLHHQTTIFSWLGYYLPPESCIDSFLFPKPKLPPVKTKHIYFLMQKGNFYLTKTVIDSDSNKFETEYFEFEIVNYSLQLKKTHSFKYSSNIDYAADNYLNFNCICVNQKTYGIFTLKYGKRHKSYVINYDDCNTYTIPGDLIFCYGEKQSCKCHKYASGYMEHLRKMLFRGQCSHYIFDCMTNNIHRIESNRTQTTKLSYSDTRQKYTMCLSSRFLVFPDYLANDRKSVEKMRFKIEKNYEEIVLEACTLDNSFIYRCVVLKDETMPSPFISNFEMLGQILSDAIIRKKKYVDYEYISEKERLVMFINVDTNYHKYTINYVLKCIKHPLNVENETKKLREEVDHLRELYL